MINAITHPLSEIFSYLYEYYIPPYQRPYSWNSVQAEDLFNDLHNFFKDNKSKSKKEERYFLGSIVLIKPSRESPISYVVDGQQRLITLTILLSMIRYFLHKHGEEYQKKYKELIDDIEKHINEPGDSLKELKAKPRLLIRETDGDQAFFKENIQDFNFDKLRKFLGKKPEDLKNDTKKNIKENSKHLEEKLSAYNPSVKKEDEKDIKEFVNFIMERCMVVVIDFQNLDSAFTIFSTLNGRGVELQTSDIIKAKVIGRISKKDKREEKKEMEKMGKDWEEIESELGVDNFNTLFSYIRIIHTELDELIKLIKDKNKKRLTHREIQKNIEKDIEKNVLNGRTSQDFFNQVLEPYAEAFQKLNQCNYNYRFDKDDVKDDVKDDDQKDDPEKVNGYLKWLKYLRSLNKDDDFWVPLAMFVIKKRYPVENVEWFFKQLERLAFYIWIKGAQTEKKTDRYKKIIDTIGNKNNESLEKDSLLKGGLLGLTSDEEKMFVEHLSGYRLSKEPPLKNKGRARYVLSRLELLKNLELSKNKELNLFDYLDSATIEHVLPDKIDNTRWKDDFSNEDKQEWYYRIANLVLLTAKENSEAGNDSFEDKRKIYQKAEFKLTKEAGDEDGWTLKVLEKRQEKLMGHLSAKKLWDLPHDYYIEIRKEG